MAPLPFGCYCRCEFAACEWPGGIIVPPQGEHAIVPKKSRKKSRTNFALRNVGGSGIPRGSATDLQFA